MKSAWAKYENDFNNLTDAQIDDLTRSMHDQLDEAEEWLEAVVAWRAYGSPRRTGEA